MKPRTFHLLLTLALTALLALAPVAQGKDDYEKEIEVDPGQRIELEMKHGGSLEVTAWDQDLVRIVIFDEHRNLSDYDIEAESTRYGVRFSAELDDRRENYTDLTVELTVPREFDIETSSAGGHIQIEGVTGEFEGRTGGGGITLVNVEGEADLSTGGGRIEILESNLDGRVSTGGGGALVRDVVGNVKVSSGGGIVSYENVRDRDGDLRGPGRIRAEGVSDGTILYNTAGGGIKLKSAPEGAIVNTGGGDIRIRGAERFVKASTGGGDIEIEVGDGWVAAGTGAGDIEVTVTDGFGDGEDGIDLSTGHGRITVTLPADASVTFDLDLMYTRNSRRDYDIDSDFELDLEHTKDWDSRRGSPRKHIYGTASINGGRHKVIIDSVNGDIRIRKK